MVNANSKSLSVQSREDDYELIELRKHLACPPGCSQATEAYASINSLDAKPIPVIVDSGSDIMLI